MAKRSERAHLHLLARHLEAPGLVPARAGGPGNDISGVNFRAFIRVFADSREDRRIGEELRRYFQENAWFRDWLQRVKAIVVDGGVIAVATDLGRGNDVRLLSC
jgi:hypothetical protein